MPLPPGWPMKLYCVFARDRETSPEAILSFCPPTSLMSCSYSDMAHFIPAMCCLHVIDVATLKAFLHLPQALDPSASLSSNSILARAANLTITLSLPVASLEALGVSDAVDDGSSLALSTASDSDFAGIWTSLAPGLARLPQLRNLHVWLDHTGSAFWSSINERALLSRFETIQASVAFTLPKLHPKHVNEQRHYREGQAAPFSIRRALRQRYRVVKDGVGAPIVTYSQDFPFCIGHPSSKGKSLAEIEDYEAGLWNRGTNVKLYLSHLR